MNERTRSQPVGVDDIGTRLTLSMKGRVAARPWENRGLRAEIRPRHLGRRATVRVPALLDSLAISTVAA